MTVDCVVASVVLVTVPLASVLVAVKRDLKGLILEFDVPARNTDAEASRIPELPHATDDLVPCCVGARLQVLLDVFLQEALVV